MFNRQEVNRVGIRGKVPPQLKIGGGRSGAARLGRTCLKICRERLNLIGAERFVFSAREVAGDVAEESRWIAKRQESLKAELKEMFAEQEDHFGASQHAQFAGEAEPMRIGAE